MSKTIRHIWTDEQKEYLKEIAEGKPRKEIKDLINAKNIGKSHLQFVIFSDDMKKTE